MNELTIRDSQDICENCMEGEWVSVDDLQNFCKRWFTLFGIEKLTEEIQEGRKR